jgi:hypothetical protein
MLETILFILFVVISIEATTELVSKSEFFSPIRAWFFRRRSCRLFKFIHDILDCPYCLSVWVSCFFIGLFYIIIFKEVYFYVLLPVMLITHRLANILHFIIDRIRGI